MYQGDSGGPLAYGNRLIGIASVANINKKLGCVKRKPDVWTRAEAYLDWINKNTKGQVTGLGRIADDHSSASLTLPPKISLTIVLALINLL